jgi:deoxyribodipyrimidine photolyase-related protein
MTRKKSRLVRQLALVLGDQLDRRSAAFDGFDRDRDVVWMAEVGEESTHVWTHKARIATFLSAMRHFRDDLRRRGITVDYRQLDDRGNKGSLGKELNAAAGRLRPESLMVVDPGEWRVKQSLLQTAKDLGITMDIRDDRRFVCSHGEFAQNIRGRKQIRLEYFYREMRRPTGVRMDGADPLGGRWNFDQENRGTFSQAGPGELPCPRRFRPDATTKEVLRLAERRFREYPGRLDNFDWPLSTRQAKSALKDFIEHRLPEFGQYQDAIWQGEPFLYHSRISAALNLKLLDPRDVVREVEQEYHSGHAPLNSVEGFIRQILGWWEIVRGVYWHFMPEYFERNQLQADRPLPEFFGTADTDMNCLRDAISQTLDYGYAHHIQRLTVTGLFALLLGVHPQEIHQWYLAVYVDAVEWVELPNTLGMSQYADGGVMASKRYVASGKYIDRMSNYCRGCRFDPAKAVGENACPITTLYWDFLMRHEKRLSGNNRMTMQLRNLGRKTRRERAEIRRQAGGIIKACRQ